MTPITPHRPFGLLGFGRRLVLVSLSIATLAIAVGGLHPSVKALEMSTPAELGLSETRLNAITEMLEEHVRSNRIAGAVVAIARHGRLGYLKAVGQRDVGAGLPMETSTIFRIASMTKAVTSAGVMMLHADGQLALDDPLSKFLPEFRQIRVLASVDGESIDTVAAEREPTIHDLLTHTSGLTYGCFGPEKLDTIYRDHAIPDLFVPINETLADRVHRIAKVPLKFQPGGNWDYGVSTDVLGRVIEVVTGLTLEQFFHERFFRPLKMRDTHFYVPHDQRSRLASLYTPDDQQRIQLVTEKPVTSSFLTFSADYCLADRGQFFSGGGGLVATATDYIRFLQMLLSGGQLDHVRVLPLDSVITMTQNHIGDMEVPFSGHGDRFGYGFGVLTDRGAASDIASVGSFGWGGVFNTYFWVDPQEQLIGVLMTQLFPYDHLAIREEFKRLAYQAIDDSGFKRRYWYEKGAEHANPHFNNRQLRVNSPQASVHPTFATRTEPKSSGIARIPISEDLRSVRRVDLYSEIWGGHPGTTDKRVSVNGRTLRYFPEVGSARHHCTHQYHSFNLRPMDLVNGYNSLQFACDQADTFWGHFIVDNTAIEIGLTGDDQRLQDAGLANFDIAVQATRLEDGEGFTLKLIGASEQLAAISAVHYQGRYLGFDENGNTWRTDWHGMTKARRPYGMIGTSRDAPFGVVWDTRLLPAQKRVAVRAHLEFRGLRDTVYTTPTLGELEIQKPESEQVTMHYATEVPDRFWSRAGRQKQCIIEIPIDPSEIVAAELHVVTWTGGAGDVTDYFKLNGTHFPVAEGHDHEVTYSRLPVDSGLIRRGKNVISLLSNTEHHGIEVLLPGPALVIRHRNRPAVRLIESARDESAGGLDCYKIETPRAVYYLDKVGAGLSSMIDRDGNDWLSFRPDRGSGASGEYRGFPNAVFKEAGSYFHPRNAGTDPCVTVVEEVRPSRVVISALSGNGLWGARYEFTSDACIFTLTKKPAEKKYWVLYEGTPGGKYDDSDWWMTSSNAKKQTLRSTHEGDIQGPEWDRIWRPAARSCAFPFALR